MKKTVEMSLNTARQMFQNADQITKSWLLENFTEEQLKSKCSQEEFNKVFLELFELGKQNVKFIEGTHNFKLCDTEGGWLFDINYDPENKYFWYNYSRVYLVFNEQFGLNYDEIQALMCDVMDSALKLDGVTPLRRSRWRGQ